MRNTRKLVVSAFVAFLVLWGHASFVSAQTARIVDIRIGAHASYDRLVLQLESAVEVRQQSGGGDGETVFELEARPLLPHQTLETELSWLGHVQIDATQSGTRILIAPGPRLVRAFLLQEPDRLVIDCGDPDLEPFDVPRGTRPVTSFEPPVEPAESEPAPIVVQGPEPDATPPGLEPEPAEPTSAQSPAPEEPESTPAEVELPEEPEPTPAEVGLPEEPEPTPAEVGLPEEPEPTPAEVGLPEEPEPTPAEVQSAPKLPGLEGHSTILSIGLAVLFAVLLAAAGIFALRLWRRMPRGPDPTEELEEQEISGSAIPAETIMPEEFEVGGDRLGILEKRIDDEARARMQLEERVLQLQEELKVLRDRFQRVARTKEGQ